MALFSDIFPTGSSITDVELETAEGKLSVDIIYQCFESYDKVIYQKPGIYFWYKDPKDNVNKHMRLQKKDIEAHTTQYGYLIMKDSTEKLIAPPYASAFVDVMSQAYISTYSNYILGITDTLGYFKIVPQKTCQNFKNIDTFDLPVCISIGLEFAQNSKIKSLNMPMLSGMGVQSIEGLHQLKDINVDNDVLKSIGDGITQQDPNNPSRLVIKRVKGASDNETILWAIASPVKKLSSDNTYRMRQQMMNTATGITDLYLKNLSARVDDSLKNYYDFSNMFNGANSLTNLVVDNSKCRTICDADGFRTLLVDTVEDGQMYTLLGGPPCVKNINDNHISCITMPICCHGSKLNTIHIENDYLHTYDDLVVTDSTRTKLIVTSKTNTHVLDTLAKIKSITTLGDYSFAYFQKFSNAVLSLDNVTKLGNSIFYGVSWNNNNLSMYFNNLTDIGNSFSNTGISYISLPKITSIPSGCFSGVQSPSLRVYIPSVKKLGYSSFSGPGNNSISKLKYIDGLENIEKAENNCFYNQTAVLSLDLNKCTSVGNNCFQRCHNLTSLNIPQVSSIGTNVFNDCRALLSVSLPSIKHIPDSAFMNSTALQKIIIPENNEFFTTENDGAVLYAKDKKKLIWGSISKTKALTADNSCLSIADCAFYACKSFSSISSQNVKYIGQQAFYDCRGLLSAYFPSCTSFGQQSFSFCSNIKYIDASSLSKERMAEISASIGLTVSYDCKISCSDGEISI